MEVHTRAYDFSVLGSHHVPIEWTKSKIPAVAGSFPKNRVSHPSVLQQYRSEL
jgi:hypothetical protein